MNFTQALTNFTRAQIQVCPGVVTPLILLARGVGYPISYILPSHMIKGGETTGARGALAPFKFAEVGLSPPYVMAL